jgi:hypothetical protein
MCPAQASLGDDKPFPKRPDTDDEWCSQLIDLMSVPGYPNVYLLGAFAKYVTIYAQQVRALNLVAALVRAGRLSARSRVGVIGGGIAGMTVAAAAAVVGAGNVSVFEREPSVMRLQRNCEKRFVHPHIYDWPSPRAMDINAGLPIMNWEANTAANVVSQLEKAWHETQLRVGARLNKPVCGIAEIKLSPGDGTPKTLLIDQTECQFDVLIFAIGFGRETPAFGLSYWSDDELGASEHEGNNQRWLVSGIGDGALTDLMRLCIRDFQHAKILAAVDVTTRDQIGAQLLEAELKGEAREAAFREAAKRVGADLKKTISFRSIGSVQLNDRARELFEPHSSILNRMITAWLLENQRFEIVSGDLDRSEHNTDGHSIDVHLNGHPTITVDRLVERHGPTRPLDSQPWLQDIAASAAQRGRTWRIAHKQDDWTREPKYDDLFALDKITRASSRLTVDFGDEIGCVVVTGHGEIIDPNLAYRVEQALGRLGGAKGTERYAPGRALATKPEHLRLEDLLQTSALYERTVRALCASEIAVFDVTGYQSAMMLLLGIRSVVRRGVTVVVTQDESRVVHFNIASLNPLSVAGDLVGDLAKAFESGFAGLVASGDRYLDLPAYDPVRALGGDYRIRAPETEILMLRWFDDQYEKTVGDPIVRSHLEDTYKSADIITTLDSRSPQLVDQRLYAALRRTRLCVADWTASRPSVFFESGVRLAVSEHHPLFIICEEKPRKWKDNSSPWPERNDPWIPALEKLFGLTRFGPSDPSPLGKRIKAYSKDPIASARGALLSPGRTYAAVCEAIDRAREPGGSTVQSFLLGQADHLAGPGGVDEGDVPVLYGDVLKEQVRRAAVEHSLAAWYYHLGRFKILEKMESNEIERTDPQLEALEQIGSKLSARFRNVSEEFAPFRTEVVGILKKIRNYKNRKDH